MNNTPNIEERFRQPEGWSYSFIENTNTSHKINYGYALPQGAPPKGIIFLLQGLQEFTEKYYETARDLLAAGYGVVLFDWQYQGRSGRLSSNPHKRHSDGFSTDIDDLHHLIHQVIKPKFPTLPLMMLSHSTGGCIGLHYLLQYPQDFSAASFGAPLLGIYGLSKFPDALINGLLSVLKICPNSYVPGGKNWSAADRKGDGTGKFSSDPMRDSITNKWYLYDTTLQGGSPTIQWLYSAYQAMGKLKNSDTLKSITTPCYFGLAEKDIIVDTSLSAQFLKHIPNAKIEILKNSKHEILMETDDIRGQFLKETLALFDAHSAIN